MSRWFLGPASWSELERTLSGRPDGQAQADRQAQPDRQAQADRQVEPDRRGSEPDATHATTPSTMTAVPYAELHAHSYFSFLDGASSPEDMVAEAARLGLGALALVDHDGFPGVIRFSQAAHDAGIATVIGAELTLGTDPGRIEAPTDHVVRNEARSGLPDPQGEHLLVLARNLAGYRALSRTIAQAYLDGNEKGKALYRLESLAEEGRRGNWLVLTGCRKGAVPAAARRRLEAGDVDGAVRDATAALDRLVGLFGAENVAVELQVGADMLSDELADVLALAATAVRDAHGLTEDALPLVATSGAHYASPQDRHLGDVLSALRARRTLEDIDGYLSSRRAHLRSGEEMMQALRHHPEAVEGAARIGRECALDLALVAPQLPPFPVPDGHDEASWLRELTERCARDRYGDRAAERVPGAWAQIDKELDVIENLGFPGYFLIVHDLVAFCRREGILCQGRGSAANSAVCYALGITAVDPVLHGLLFERFLSPERDGPPDIDVDIASDRREEVIQYVYATHGRQNAAQVANVITYRTRMAVRDAARVLGYDAGQQDAWSRQIERSSSVADAGVPAEVAAIAGSLRDLPRHLGIHSGGMVLCDRPVIEVCPVEWARMEGRTVLQWDKEDCADAGLVKFDLLGLGMLTALDHAFRLIERHHGEHWELHTVPQEDPAVYDMLCAADSVGVFQVESRAQMSTLPRLKPRKFYDLVVEVALIRPGPIQGGSVHPYIRRANGLEEPRVPHPLLHASLDRTLGIPLFQEQLMQMAVDVADFTPAEADRLRRAMGSKRSPAKMQELRERLFAGMAGHGITGELAESIFAKLLAFANYGFPESHAYSFAYLVYASAVLKCYYPAAMTAALLRAQPMGFYSPQSLVADARRHGVRILGPDVNASAARADLAYPDGNRPYTMADVAGHQVQGTRAAEGPALRMGLDSVRGVSTELAEGIVAAREQDGPFASASDLARRVQLDARRLEALAAAGALDDLVGESRPRDRHREGRSSTRGAPGGSSESRSGDRRRRAMWGAGAAAAESPATLPGVVVGTEAPMLPGMSDAELAAVGAWATGVTVADYPTVLVRDRLTAEGVLTVAGLRGAEDGARVRVGGAVTHRQRPTTAQGVAFLGLEDETGLLNVVCSQGLWTRHRILLRTARALVVRGRVEKGDGAINLLADGIEELVLPAAGASRDFR